MAIRELDVKKGRHQNELVVITSKKTGKMTLSRKTRELLYTGFGKETKAIKLLLDSETKTFWIKPCEPSEKNARALYVEKHIASLGGKGLLEALGQSLDETKAHPVTWDTELKAIKVIMD